MKNFRTRLLLFALLLIACVFSPRLQAKEGDEFTAGDLRIAMLLEKLGDVIEARDRAIAAGVDPKDARTDAVDQCRITIDSLKELTDVKRMIILLEDELATLQGKGLAPGHPVVRRLSDIIMILRASEKKEAKQVGGGDGGKPPN